MQLISLQLNVANQVIDKKFSSFLSSEITNRMGYLLYYYETVYTVELHIYN